MKWFFRLLPIFLLVCVYGCHSFMKDLANQDCNQDWNEYCQEVLKESYWHGRYTAIEEREAMKEECRKILNGESLPPKRE